MLSSRNASPDANLSVGKSPVATKSSGAPPTRRLTAVEVGRVLGSLDLEVARRHHVEMAAVMAELAEDAGLTWPWTHDDPTVAVLRSLARLSLLAPGAVSERAWSLCRRVEVGGSENAGMASRRVETVS